VEASATTAGGNGNRLSDARLELLITIGLGLAAIVTALFVYLTDVHDDEADLAFSDGVAQVTEATGSYVTASQLRASDENLFAEYAQLAYAASLGDKFSGNAADYLREGIMREDLEAAVVWWSAETQKPGGAERYPTPFVEDNPEYTQPELAQAEAESAAAQASFTEAEDEQKAGDTFIIADIIVASSLFFFGLAGVVSARLLKVRVTVLGYVLFVASIAIAVFG
jgi:hypothetical protein